MNMKKIAIFFSDIIGTIKGFVPNKPVDYYQFNQLLETIRQKEEVEEVILSLISADDIKLVIDMQKELESYIKKPIVFGHQFFENGCYNETETIYTEIVGRIKQIVDYIHLLSKEYDITAIYYVDDSLLYHEILELFAEEDAWIDKLQSIRPKNNLGLSEVNSLIEQNLSERFTR